MLLALSVGPGEFSARAYLNGKLTLAQAEGVAATIAAHTERELAAAESLLAGETGDRHRAWAEELATLLALVEAGIDFTDQEDVVPIPPGALLNRVTSDVRDPVGTPEYKVTAVRLQPISSTGSRQRARL